jgi:hypothetical protein
VRALHKQLKLAERAKTLAEDELKDANLSIAQLKDELQTTSRSYEGQLSMMSEHLAGMNEKLTSQKDEIDELKAQHAQQHKGGVLSKVKGFFVVGENGIQVNLLVSATTSELEIHVDPTL